MRHLPYERTERNFKNPNRRSFKTPKDKKDKQDRKKQDKTGQTDGKTDRAGQGKTGQDRKRQDKQRDKQTHTLTWSLVEMHAHLKTSCLLHEDIGLNRKPHYV